MASTNSVTAKLMAAKAALAQAKTTLPSTPTNDGHSIGQQFAQQHKADPQGGTISGLVQQAGGEKQGLDARVNAMKQLLPQ